MSQKKRSSTFFTGLSSADTAALQAHGRPYGRGWMVTFTDLVALMLTFFVLLFSMSQIEQPRWQNLVDAFSVRLDNTHEIDVALPVAELDVKPVVRVAATDLDYLDLILREKLASEDGLADAVMWNRGDRVVISLPASLLFAAGAGELGEESKRLVFILGGLLQKIDNRVEVAAHALAADESDATKAWQLSLTRALAVADMLKRAGYAQGVVARGHGAAGRLPDDLTLPQRARLEERVDIVVFADRAP